MSRNPVKKPDPPAPPKSIVQLLSELSDEFYGKAVDAALYSYHQESRTATFEECKAYGRAEAYLSAARRLREFQKEMMKRGWVW